MMMMTGAGYQRQRLADVWYAVDSLWRTAQFVHLAVAAVDATWQASH